MRACAIGNQVILLDLQRGRYFGVVADPQCGMSQHIDGWPGPEGVAASALSRRAAELTNRLSAQGVLTPPGPVRDCRPHLDEAASTLDAYAAGAPRRPRLQGAAGFIASASLAWTWLQVCSLGSIARRITAGRPQPSAAVRAEMCRPLGDAVCEFESLRPLVFTTRDNCLFDSLALLHFLGRGGIHARWVVGVRIQPFGAHSWLQIGDMVLNDLHENVRRFRPILVV